MASSKHQVPLQLGKWLLQNWRHPLLLAGGLVCLPLLTWIFFGIALPTWWMAWLVFAFCILKEGLMPHRYLFVLLASAILAGYCLALPTLNVLMQGLILLSVAFVAEGLHRSLVWSLLFEGWVVIVVLAMLVGLSFAGEAWIALLQSAMKEQMSTMLAMVQSSFAPNEIRLDEVKQVLSLYLTGGMMFDVFITALLTLLLAQAWVDVIKGHYRGIVHRICGIEVSRSVLILTGVLVSIVIAFDGSERYNGLIPSLMVLFLPYVVAGYGVLCQKISPKNKSGLKLGYISFHLGVVVLFPLSAMVLGGVGLLDSVVHFRRHQREENMRG